MDTDPTADTPSNGAAWMDGRVVPIDQARLPVTDWGLTHADAVYDVVPVWDGAFFRLDDYLARFAASRAAWRLDAGLSDEAIRRALHAMVAASGLRNAYVSMVVTRGRPTRPGTRDPRLCANRFFAWCVPFVWIVPDDVAAAGPTLLLAQSVRRIPDICVNQRIKNYHWADLTMGLFEAKDAGYESCLLVAPNGTVAEGPGFNVFWAARGRLFTPARNCLHGVTRKTVIEIAHGLGVEVREGDHQPDALLAADEVFIATSGGGAVWIGAVDDASAPGLGFRASGPGPITKEIAGAYQRWLAERADLRTPIGTE